MQTPQASFSHQNHWTSNNPALALNLQIQKQSLEALFSFPGVPAALFHGVHLAQQCANALLPCLMIMTQFFVVLNQ